MIKRLLTFLPILFFATLISCDSDKKDKSTYFGGKIINPKTNHVVLYSMEKVIDTFLLDSNNKFIGKVKDVNEGLYYFIHGNENQYIYLEPLDSLMLRLNTWDFDESLVFAGKGAERNNILIDCFLEDEKGNKVFYGYNKLEPAIFKRKTDSITNIKLNTYNDYVTSHPNETEGFKNILKVALTYPTYAKIERYPLLYAKYSDEKNILITDESFYDFRESVSFNNDSLMYYPPYSQYVRNYLYNETYSLGHTPNAEGYSSKFTTDLMNIIDSKIKSEETRNAFLKQTVISHFYRKSSGDINLNTFKQFFELSSNKNDKEHVRKLLNDNNSISKNTDLQDFEVIDFTESRKSINKVTKGKNSFIFFWSSENVSHSYISSRIDYLSKKYPSVEFILVNFDDKKAERIHKVDIKSQFYIDASCKAHQFLTSKMPRAIILNKEGKIENGYASISSYNINYSLKALKE